VVDDDAGVRDLLVKVLRNAGYRCTAETKLPSRGTQADVVLTDVPRPPTLYALKRLVSRVTATRAAEVVLVTAHLEVRAGLARRVGAAAVLRKPFSRADLLRTVDAALVRRRA
jgi:CheY-like chemotaxis protein